jgi:hypothetical protein
MSSKITIAALQGGTNPGQIASLSNIGTTETAFTLVPNPIVGGTAAAVLSLPDPTLFDNGGTFKVKIAGMVTTNVSTTVAVKLYLGSDTNLSNNKVLVAPTAINVNSNTSQFRIEDTVSWDSVSQVVNGDFVARIGGTTAGPTQATAATSVTAASQLQFVPSGVFGAANAANTLKIYEMSIEPA